MSTHPFTPVNIRPEIITEDAPETSGGNVATTTLPPPPADPTSQQRMRLIEISGTLDFWNSPEEDIYGAEDGEPL